ncbi:MAG: sugar ABC transporter permease [Anaerolineae bacterium]|nr:sugar ABC transporter permease [Anaerolineae bacterium]MDW8171663.1 sugar ABC transporter permease [Anaerolineae bacterium]
MANSAALDLSSADKPKRSWPKFLQGETLVGWSFLTPSVIILFVFLILPLLMAFYFSFTNWSGTRPLDQPDAYQFVGFDNYQRWIIDGRRTDDFYRAVRNTLYYVLGVVPVQTVIALVLAVIVNQRWLRYKGFFRTAFYFPSITSSIVVSFIFLFLFSAGGPINTLLQVLNPSYQPIAWTGNNDGLIHLLLGGLGITRDTAGEWAQARILGLRAWDWIAGPSVALSTIMALAVWTTTGTLMVIYLSALQGIPSSVYEAAEVDGATGWAQFRYITLPLLKPTTFFVITLGLIGTFQVFDQIYVLQNDTTARTTTSVAYLVYTTAFRGTSPNLAEASAIAVVLFVIIFIATLLQRRFVGGDQAEY